MSILHEQLVKERCGKPERLLQIWVIPLPFENLVTAARLLKPEAAGLGEVVICWLL